MITNKLINPTPFDVEIEWNRGIVLKIQADSEFELTMPQLEDFRDGKPGSEESKSLLDFYGLFLLDGDRSWEEQAITALRKSHKEKQERFDNFISRIRDSRIAQGSPVDDEALEEMSKRNGYDRIKKQCEQLQRRITHLSGLLESSGTKGKVKETLDPKRTCFITSPPKQFPSETALHLFLMDQTDEFRAKHDAYTKSLLGEDE